MQISFSVSTINPVHEPYVQPRDTNIWFVDVDKKNKNEFEKTLLKTPGVVSVKKLNDYRYEIHAGKLFQQEQIERNVRFALVVTLVSIQA